MRFNELGFLQGRPFHRYAAIETTGSTVFLSLPEPRDTYLKRLYRSPRSGSSAIYLVFAKKKRKKEKNSGQVTRAVTACIYRTSVDYNNDVKAIRAWN